MFLFQKFQSIVFTSLYVYMKGPLFKIFLSLTRNAMSYPKGLAPSWRMYVKLVSCFFKCNFSFQKNQWSHCDTFPGD